MPADYTGIKLSTGGLKFLLRLVRRAVLVLRDSRFGKTVRELLLGE
jgi:hypothetical protein